MRTILKAWPQLVIDLRDNQFEGNASELARAVGVSPQAVSRWISHGSVPRYAVLRQLARVTGIPFATLEAIAHPEPPGTSGADAEPGDARSEDTNAAEIARRIPAEQLDAMLAHLDAELAAGRLSRRAWRAVHDSMIFAAEVQLKKEAAAQAKRSGSPAA